MRVILAALTFVVVSILSAGLFASAASIGLTGTKLGANTATVASCDTDGVTATWATAYDQTLPGYKVTSVTVSGIDVACSGATLSVTLSDAGGTALGSISSVTVSGTSEVLAVTGTVNATSVENTGVVITGP